MAEDRERDEQASAAAAGRFGSDSEVQTGPDSEVQTYDPGRTPGKAEGDEETIDESLRRQEKQ